MAQLRAGRGLTVLLLLAACDRQPQPEPKRAAEPGAAPLTTFRPPVLASPEPSAAASPLADESATPAATASPTATLASYPPRDECAKLPGFAVFREKLFVAVKARDAGALAALADPAVHLDFGGGAGRDELTKRLTAATGPGLWSELAALAPLGCAADAGVATLPWIFARVPEDADPFRTMLVTGLAVPMRGKATATAKPVRTLDWALVTLSGMGFDPKAPYAKVEAGGATGFVETARLRSVIDYRLIAERKGEGWAIVAFIAGD